MRPLARLVSRFLFYCPHQSRLRLPTAPLTGPSTGYSTICLPTRRDDVDGLASSRPQGAEYVRHRRPAQAAASSAGHRSGSLPILVSQPAQANFLCECSAARSIGRRVGDIEPEVRAAMTRNSLQIRPLSGAIGAEITGIDLAAEL